MANQEKIQQLIHRARGRIRLQYVLDAGTLGLAVGLFVAAVIVALVKMGAISPAQQTLWLALCAVFPQAGMAWAGLRRIDPIAVAAAIDRSNSFNDRLSSAFEFMQEKEPTTFQRAQIRDTLAK